MSNYISKIDSKGRISIPIALRLKLKLIEGSSVYCIQKGKKLILIPANGQSGIKASIGDCGSSRLGSIPGSGPKRGDKNER